MSKVKSSNVVPIIDENCKFNCCMITTVKTRTITIWNSSEEFEVDIDIEVPDEEVYLNWREQIANN